jgi:hypothetical protein
MKEGEADGNRTGKTRIDFSRIDRIFLTFSEAKTEF